MVLFMFVYPFSGTIRESFFWKCLTVPLYHKDEIEGDKGDD